MLSIRRQSILFLLFVLGASALLYHQSWDGPFVLDDLTKIQENSDLRTPFHLRNFIYPYADAKMHFRNDPSRPLTFMAYWLCWQTAHGSPYPFHVLSTILHGLCAALLGLLVAQLSLHLWRETSLVASLTAAMLFLCSPILAGTVVYAYGLSDVLCASLILAALLLISGRGPLRLRNLVAMNFLYLLALATKQSAIVLPGLVLVWDLFIRPSELRNRREWLRKYRS